MIRKIIETTFPSAASITFRISSGRARSVKCSARTTLAALLLEGDVPVGSELPITTFPNKVFASSAAIKNWRSKVVWVLATIVWLAIGVGMQNAVSYAGDTIVAFQKMHNRSG
jgi:hypothetical protein